MCMDRTVPAAAVIFALAVCLCVSAVAAKERAVKNAELRKRLEQLRSLPYSTVSPDSDTAESGGVSVYDTSRAYRGYNLFAVPERGAALIDMEGRIVHEWRNPIPDVNDFNEAKMLPGGDLLGVSERFGLVVLGWDSDVILSRKMNAHHDASRAGDGTYFALSYETRRYRDLDFRFDTIMQLSSELKPLREWSTFDNLDRIKQAFDQRSFTDGILDSMIAAGISPAEQEHELGRLGIRDLPQGDKLFDYFHLNTVSLLPDTPLGRKDQRFRAGNILTCARNVNQVAILDSANFEIVWVWGEGVLEWPHHPTMLDNGNILIFDNGVLRKYSSVVEVNPVTKQIVWQYIATPPESFYSYQSGSAQRLPNGNTLICEAAKGHTFEVTREGKIVWEWRNPVINAGRRVSIYRMLRLSPEEVEPLLAR